MKASKLIEHLAHIISTYGNIEVAVEDDRAVNINIDTYIGDKKHYVAVLNAYYNPNEEED